MMLLSAATTVATVVGFRTLSSFTLWWPTLAVAVSAASPLMVGGVIGGVVDALAVVVTADRACTASFCVPAWTSTTSSTNSYRRRRRRLSNDLPLQRPSLPLTALFQHPQSQRQRHFGHQSKKTTSYYHNYNDDDDDDDDDDGFLSASVDKPPPPSALHLTLNSRPHQQPVVRNVVVDTPTKLQQQQQHVKLKDECQPQFTTHLLLPTIRGGDGDGSGGGGGDSDHGETSSTPSIDKKKLVLLPCFDATLRRELLAEFMGTYLIVMIGTGSVMSAIFTDSLVGLFQVASVWIVAVTIAISCTASISGAHLNPAISIALAAIRDFEWSKVVPYSAAQVAGATMGSATNLLMYGSTIQAYERTHGIVRASATTGMASAKAFGEYFASPVTTMTAFLAESIGTAILAFVIFALTHPQNNDTVQNGFVPPLIGLTVGALIAVVAPLTQAGFNPARDFGPRIVAWLAGWKAVAFTKAWVYIVAPIVGALGGAFLADRVLYISPTTSAEDFRQ